MSAIAGMQQGLLKKPQDTPDEERKFADNMGSLKVYKVGGAVIGHGTFQPGWRWSSHVKPLVGTDSCQAAHTGIVLSGAMRVRMDNGEEMEYRTGDSFSMQPGHDAWVVGNRACEMLDFTGAANYALPHEHGIGAGSEAQRNKEIVMQGYQDFAQQNLDSLLSRYTDDIEWVGYESQEVPFAGTYRGKDEVRRFFQELGGAFETVRFEPQQMVAEGDRVMVSGHCIWRMRTGGRELEYDWVHVFDLRNGKVARFQHFDDSAQTVDAFREIGTAAALAGTQPTRPPMHS